ncbi:hypothetical protein [Bosea psychrotolerans]|uniref:Uncharacterized protein n=1 Tax=Bosea psychrotolerans TaxID=1871628 RepID=A0A2S4LXG6_9HYPH|nr:hypothetical protein [Bosea psychrotolerans]POR47136.1 hypothetical protein CYD53_12026 [Bosea psychrotolerans]
MFDLFKAWQAKRAVYSVLAPFMRLAMPEAPPNAWLAPHVIGFLATLVTCLAERHSGELRSHAMASIQASVLRRLTGIGEELIGERITLLSSLGDPSFEAGCAGALAFLAAREAALRGSTAELADDRDDARLAELWREHVQQFLRPDLQR